MEIIRGFDEFKKFTDKNKKRMDQLHLRPITFEEWKEKSVSGMEDIRQFCEGLRFVHESHLATDPLKEIKQEKIAVFWCYTFDPEIIEEVKMYELETGIKIFLLVEEFDDESRKEKKIPAFMSWEPTQRDADWLRGTVDSLRVGGHWQAPMGFLFEKTDEDEITLIEAKNDESLIAIYQTVKVGQKAGINVIVDVLNDDDDDDDVLDELEEVK